MWDSIGGDWGDMLVPTGNPVRVRSLVAATGNAQPPSPAKFNFGITIMKIPTTITATNMVTIGSNY